jgi:hypothetical protein
MHIVAWLKSGFSTRRKALWSYRRGMARAKRCDYEGALANCTAAIDLASVPADVKAMALYNRALAYVAAGDDAKGVDDLDAVLAMDGTMVILNIMTMAKQKLTKMESRTRRSKV